MKRKQVIGILCVAAVVLAALAVWRSGGPWPRSSSSSSHPKVRIAVNPTAFFLPLLVAQDQGYFTAEGLDAELLMLSSTSDATNALLNGDAEVSSLGGAGIVFILEASPDRVSLFYAQYCQGYSLLVPTNSSIKSLENLKGKRIGTWQSPTPELLLRMLLDERIGRGSFTAVPIASRFQHQAMQRGEVDAIFIADVHARMSLDTGESRVLSESPMEEFVDRPFFNGGGVVRSDYARSHPDIVKRIRAASNRAIDFISSNPTEARQSLVTHLKVSEKTAAAARTDQFVTLAKFDHTTSKKLAERMQHAGATKSLIDVPIVPE